MPDVRALKSYLIGLGFQVDKTQLNQFNAAIAAAAKTVNDNVESMTKQFLKWESAAIAAFASVGAAAVATADKIASRDEAYRIWGESMFLDARHARVLKQALDAMGYSLGQIAFDPELHQRMAGFMGMLRTLEGEQPGGTEGTLRTIRAIRAEFTMFRFEIDYFLRIVFGKIVQALGGDKFLARLRAINEYIVAHIPQWSDIFVRDVVPVLKITYQILGDIWTLVRDIATLVGTVFDNLVGFFSMDTSIMGVANLDKFSHALSKVAVAIGWVVRSVIWLQGVLLGAAGGASIGAAIGALGGPIGAGAGALIGAGAGGVFDLVRHAVRSSQDTGALALPELPAGAGLDAVTQGVAMVESGGRQTDRFGRTITSSAGALGIMQLLPSTARQLGVDPYNAAQNLAGGRAYLAQLFARYGNWHDALGAYNWGPGNVDRALRMHRAFPAAVEAYTRAVGAHMAVGPVTINVMQPHATPEQIAGAVAEGFERTRAMHTTSALTELKGIYG